MIRKLSTRHFLLFLIGVLGFTAVGAQPTTITTSYTSGGASVNLNNSPAYPSYVTFMVTNNNTYPIAITEIGSLHIHSSTITSSSVNYSEDTGTYSLWSSGTNNLPITSLPPSVTNNWTLLASGPNIITTANGITPVIPTELTATNRAKEFTIICPNSYKIFAIALNDTIAFATAATSTPTSFTAGGVTLDVASGKAGFFSGGTTLSGFFYGSITFDKAYPATPSITADVNPICVGGSVNLTANPIACATSRLSYTWIGPGISSPNDTGKTIAVNNITSTSTYKVVVYDSSTSLYSDTASIVINVNSDVAPLILGRTQYCINDNFELPTVNGLPATDNAVHWFSVPTGGSPLPAAPTVNTSLGAQIDTFYASVVINGQCESQRSMVIYTVAPPPPAPVVTTPIYYCAGSPSIPLEASGQNLNWYYQKYGGVPSTLAPEPPTSVPDTFEYYVAQVNNGCEGPRANVHVVVTFRPNGLILASRDEICKGDTVTFSYYGSAFAGSAFVWDFSQPGLTQISGGTGIDPKVVRFDSSYIKTVSLKVGNTNCWSPVYTHDIIVDSIPEAKIAANKDLCQGRVELISLLSYDPSIDSFAWNFDGGQTTHYATDQGPYGVFWPDAGEHYVSLVVSNGKCSATVLDTVEVHAYPDARIDIQNYNSDALYCAGDSLKMAAHTIDPSSKYVWTPTRFFDIYDKEPVTYGRIDFNSYVKLMVTDQYGCTNSDSLLVKTQPCCKLIFPTAFSPNGDGKNDMFHMLNNGHYDVKTFHIANRWGTTVYETTNEQRGWDGTFNGEPQDMGTYYYFISYMCNGQLMTQKGEVILVR